MSDVDLTTPAETAGAALALLRQTGTIVRPRWQDDGAGGRTPAMAGPERIVVAYALAARSGNTVLAGGAPGAPQQALVRALGTHVLSLPPATDIRDDDLFETASGARYQVVYAPEPSPADVLRVVTVEEAI